MDTALNFCREYVNDRDAGCRESHGFPFYTGAKAVSNGYCCRAAFPSTVAPSRGNRSGSIRSRHSLTGQAGGFFFSSPTAIPMPRTTLSRKSIWWGTQSRIRTGRIISTPAPVASDPRSIRRLGDCANGNICPGRHGAVLTACKARPVDVLGDDHCADRDLQLVWTWDAFDYCIRAALPRCADMRPDGWGCVIFSCPVANDG